MQLRNPFWIENLMQDQPYASLLLVSPFCDFACAGCQNKILREQQVVDFSLEELCSVYQSNPFVDGITVAGLEPCLSGERFLKDVVEFIKKANIPRVTVYSRFTLGHKVLRQFIEALHNLSCIQELYVKVGAYQAHVGAKQLRFRSLTRPEQIWEIVLASANQDFLVIKSDKWQFESVSSWASDMNLVYRTLKSEHSVENFRCA